jgi:hypothetical protein
MALVPIWNAINNPDDDFFNKWFGKSTAESDADVFSRLLDAANLMEQRGDMWDVLCCDKSAVGACRDCRNGAVIAYVTHTYDEGLAIKNTYVRACPGLLDNTNDMAVGLSYFHELVHTVSHVGDESGAYEKIGAHQLAVDEPEVARLSANNYMLYAAQTGMSHEEYYIATSEWGAFTWSPTCYDSFGNCHELVERAGCCTGDNRYI